MQKNTPLSPSMHNSEINKLTVTALAQVGDAVFELMVRTHLCQNGTLTARALHARRVEIVCAAAQSEAASRLQGALTEEETAIYKRGRNTHVARIPKGASRREYQTATALETLWGWLWLHSRVERLEILFALLRETEKKS